MLTVTLSVALLGVLGATGACKPSRSFTFPYKIQTIISRHLHASNRKACTHSAFHVILLIMVCAYRHCRVCALLDFIWLSLPMRYFIQNDLTGARIHLPNAT